MTGLFVRYIKYMGTSVVGTIVDTLVLWLLSDYVFTKGYWGEYVVSPVISFQCAVATNFTIFYFYVWRDRTRHFSGWKRFIRRFLAFDLSCSSVFLIRLGMLIIIEKAFGWDVVVCNLVAMCFTGILNFIVNNLLVFRNRS